MKFFRVTLVLAAVMLAPAQTSDADDMRRNLIEFHNAYNPMFRDFFGCPRDAREVEECVPARGTVNVKEFLASKRAAIKLFDLKEK